MELLLILSTAIGTVVGVVAAIAMMNRRTRPVAIGDAALRTQLQNTEWALAAAAKDVDELRKQLAEREGVRDELERTQQQIAAIVADKENQSAQRAAAEQRASEMAEELASIRNRLILAEESARRVEEMENALAENGEAARRVIELQASLTAAEERASMAEASVVAAESRLDEMIAEATELRRQLADVSAQANSLESAAVERVRGLEAEVEALQAQAQRASATVEEMESMLRVERQSAVEAMELLSQAQDKFSGRLAPAR